MHLKLFILDFVYQGKGCGRFHVTNTLQQLLTHFNGQKTKERQQIYIRKTFINVCSVHHNVLKSSELSSESELNCDRFGIKLD